ncbi:MAG: NAD-dependent epimerase/dehydratase family protein [Pseudomonadales bacterium]
MTKEKVLLTGASGSMGHRAFKELWKRKNTFDIVLLLRPSEKNIALFAPYLDGARVDGPGVASYQQGALKIVWGDATHYADILTACEGVDIVLNPMAFIAPAADLDPVSAQAVNTTAVQYLVDAVKAQPNGAQHIRFIHIGSVAQYGDRQAPVHMIRTGDPLVPSIFDFYATTKIAGEKIVIESGIKHWVSLRQTFITIPDFFTALMDPIMFHQPVHTAIEMNTSNDAGRGLVNALDVPRESNFWGNVYNMAGGPSCRFVTIDYFARMFSELGLGDYRQIFERKWFALRNFHCGWFADSDKLNEYLDFWREDTDDHFAQVHAYMTELAAEMDAAGTPMPDMSPQGVRSMVESLANSVTGTKHWRENNMAQRMSAFYGSAVAYDNIPGWDVDMPPRPDDFEPTLLDHGYDEFKPQLDLGDLQGAAEFRGGKLLSTQWDGDNAAILNWQDAEGHEFQGSVNLILKAGHWSPHESAPGWDFDRVAARNPFFAQVWSSQHTSEERHFYAENCYKDVIEEEKAAAAV